MSRSLARQVKQSNARKLQAIYSYAATQKLNFSDCHPDVQQVLTLLFLTLDAQDFGDKVAVDNGLSAIKGVLARYGDQRKDLLTDANS